MQEFRAHSSSTSPAFLKLPFWVLLARSVGAICGCPKLCDGVENSTSFGFLKQICSWEIDTSEGLKE